jgi:enterochelin esterase-like enzyme
MKEAPRRALAHAPGELVELGRFDIPGVAAQRRVRAYLPARRPRRLAPRPLLGLVDGQNVFDDEGSFAGGWRAHRAVDRYAARRANPPVIVAIDHGHDARIDELAPFRHGARGGGADDFVGWIAGTLVPAARAALHLSPEARDTILGGSSLGGLAALYGHYRFPEVFGGALSMSPSLWFGRDEVFEFVSRQRLPWASRVYLDAGAREGGGQMLAAASRMADHLAARGYARDRLRFTADRRGAHNEAAWRRRLPGALRFLYG